MISAGSLRLLETARPGLPTRWVTPEILRNIASSTPRVPPRNLSQTLSVPRLGPTVIHGADYAPVLQD